MAMLLLSYLQTYPPRFANSRAFMKQRGKQTLSSVARPLQQLELASQVVKSAIERSLFVVEEEEEEKEKLKVNLDSRARPTVVVVDPKITSTGPISRAMDYLQKLLIKLMHDSSRPMHYLSGNFAPVMAETPPTDNLTVRGHLPDCLNGQFLRVGPNPKFAPIAGYHWFDGDGMIHGLRIKDGKTTYVSRYLQTSHLKQEEFFGSAKFLKVGDMKGPFGLLMIILQSLRLQSFDISYGLGTGNTSLVYHHRRILVLQEIDKPYVIKSLENGDLQTLGLLDYDKRLQHCFTVHPKIDPFTGEMFAFGCSPVAPYVTYRVISRDGFMHDPVTITIPKLVMMHDFAITESYVIFMDLPLYLKLGTMLKANTSPYTFDGAKNARFGVLPRYAENEREIRWFELPNCFIFHNANAWEEGDEVVLISCRVQNPNLEGLSGAVAEKVENFASELYEMRFNMKSGQASQKKLSAPNIEFPRINESFTGRKHRYVYGAIMNSIDKLSGIAKFDLQDEPDAKGQDKVEVGGNVKGVFHLGPGRFCSDFIFIPRDPGISSSKEDDGYLIFFAHDENSGKSEVIVIDARTMSADPVAVVELPNRVPYGFHALFVTEEQIRQQEM